VVKFSQSVTHNFRYNYILQSTKIIYHALDGFSLHRIHDGVQVDSAFIAAVVENIEGLDCRLTPLPPAKNEINPFVDVS
jgi:hypothetical protein